jgi:NAD(P)-dependent dehydrogenase (short-subunit alcohol dehydrogenase family)
MNRVKNKVVMVTGGASGIGKATCLLLADEGAVVAVTDIDDAKGQQVVDTIQKKGGKAKFWHCTRSYDMRQIIGLG